MRRSFFFAVAIPAALLLMAVPAVAQDAEPLASEVQFNLDVIYFFLAASLVFMMQAGFAMLETGMTRAKNSANIMMKNMVDCFFGVLAYFLIGFGLMYGASQAGIIGFDTFALSAGSYTDGIAADPFVAVDFFYQAVFAATAATIVSGAVAGRMKFPGYVITSVVMTVLIYPMVGHWKWGGGWLDSLGFYDFAGSTVVHVTGGTAGLVIAAILGPRIGKFGANGKARAIPGHSAPLAALGMFLLFFGWFGFNGGSVLAADGAAVAPVLLTTFLAGCAGGAAAMTWSWVTSRKPDFGMTINGTLAGLVGITAGADRVSPAAAIGVGLVAGVIVVYAVKAVDAMKIDDAVGAFAVHGVCGVLGTWWVGFYALESAGDGAYPAGLFHGGGFDAVFAQIIGTVAVVAFVAVAAGLLGLILKATNLLRVGEEEELEGLDLHEHGMYGYPELALGASAYPGGPLTHEHGHTVGLDGATAVEGERRAGV